MVPQEEEGPPRRGGRLRGALGKDPRSGAGPDARAPRRRRLPRARPGSAGVFSVSGFFWPERSSDDAEALFSLASSNLKYAMTVGWEDGTFYYEDDLGKTNSDFTYAKKTWHSIVLTTEKIASDTYHDASGVNTAKRLVKVYVDGSLAISKQTLLPDLAEDAASGGKGAGLLAPPHQHYRLLQRLQPGEAVGSRTSCRTEKRPGWTSRRSTPCSALSPTSPPRRRRTTRYYCQSLLLGCFGEGGNRGRGGRAGAEIWGKAGPPGQSVSRGTP